MTRRFIVSSVAAAAIVVLLLPAQSRVAAQAPRQAAKPAAPAPRLPQMPTHTESTHIFILFEGNVHSFRQIFMDGRPHPDDLVPTWYGHSIGHWEGDTLVVDTVGYNDRFWFDFDGHPHTTQLHTIERFTRADLNTLNWDITIIDSRAYAKPFTVQTKAEYKQGWDLMEYICNENNTNVQHIQGPAVSPGGR